MGGGGGRGPCSGGKGRNTCRVCPCASPGAGKERFGETAGRMGNPDGERSRITRGELMNSEDTNFESDVATHRMVSEPTLVVDVEGFEGPLDLLLALAR